MFNRAHFWSVFCLIFFYASYATAQPVTVSIPKDLTAAPRSSNVKVPVNVTDVTGLDVISADIIVSYDTKVLSATGVISLTEAKLNGENITTETDDGKITLVDTPPVGTVTVSIPENIITTPGATGVQVPVNVTDVTGLGVISADLVIAYDTNVLTATDAILEGTIAQEGGGVDANIDDAKGEITLGIMRAEPLSGGGVLVFIIFDVDSDDPSDSSELTFLKILLNDGGITTVTSNGDIALPVILSSFVAVADVRRNRVILIWQTESELNHLGFAIYRSKRKNGPHTKIGWVASEKDTQPPCRYRFIDETAEKGKVYFYMLEHIDIAGKAERSNAVRFDWSTKYQLITTWGKLKNR